MLTGTWSVILTALFAATGGYALWRWSGAVSARAVRPETDALPGVSPDPVIDLNQVLMSAAMVIMIWWPSGPIGSWLQVAVFAVFAVIMALSGRPAGPGVRHRAGSVAHVIMNLAMVWMLAAMPLLMPRSAGAAGGHHHGAGGGPIGPAVGQAPLWAVAVSWLATGVTVAVAVWWAVRAIRSRTERLHCCCHAAMGVGMAAMIGAMA